MIMMILKISGKKRRGFIRGLEALIAILMIIGTLTLYQWTDVKPKSEHTTRQTLSDILDTHDEIWVYAHDTALLDDFFQKNVPSNLNYKLKLRHFIPLTATPGVSANNTVLAFTVDFPAGVEPDSIKVYERDFPDILLPRDVFFNWYRTPFYVINDDSSARPKHFQISFPQYHPDSNKDNLIEGIDPQSIEVFFNGEREEFSLSDFADWANFSTVLNRSEALIDFYSPLRSSEIVDGYMYYMASAQAWPLPVREEYVSTASNLYITGPLSQFPPEPLQGPPPMTARRNAPEVKSNRALLLVQANTTAGSVNHFIVEFGIGTGESALFIPNNLTFVKSDGVMRLGNAYMNVSMSDDKDQEGVYNITFDGVTVASAKTSVGDVNLVNISRLPLNSTKARTAIRANAFVNATNARLYRYFTVFNDRNITIVNERFTPIRDLTEIGERAVLVDEVNVSASKYDTVRCIQDGHEQHYSGSYPDPISLLSNTEPWLEFSNSEDSNQPRLGIIFDKPFDNITITMKPDKWDWINVKPYYTVPETFRYTWPNISTGNFITSAHVMTRSMMFALLNPSSIAPETRKLWLENDGVVETSYDTSSSWNEHGIIDGDDEIAEFRFTNFTKWNDEIQVSVATLMLNVSDAVGTADTPIPTIECTLNGEYILDGVPADAGSIISVDFDTGRIIDSDEGVNTLTCRAQQEAAQVTVPNIILKTSAPHAIPRHFGGEWNYIRINFINNGEGIFQYNFKFNASKLLNAQAHTQLENRITNGGFQGDWDEEGNPEEWHRDPKCSNLTWDSSHAGGVSMNLTRVGKDECMVYSDDYTLDEKKNGLISFWYKKTSGGSTDDNAFISITPKNDLGTALINSSATLNLTDTDGAWMEKSFAFDFSNIPDAESFIINITLNPSWANLTTDNSVQLYIDDIDVRTGTNYILLDENGVRRGLNEIGEGKISLEVDVWANETYTLLYTDDMTYEHNDFIRIFPEGATDVTGWSDSCLADDGITNAICGNVIDSGVWSQKIFRLPPASETTYTTRSVPEGVNTEMVEKTVIDPQTGMGSIISITGWSKAGGLKG